MFLLDAIRRLLDVAESLGIRALLVHAKHEKARDFYRRLAGFELLPGDPPALYLLLNDARKTLRSQRTGAGTPVPRPVGRSAPGRESRSRHRTFLERPAQFSTPTNELRVR